MGWKDRWKGAWIALLAALADRGSKLLVARLAPGGCALIPGVINLRPVQNRGAAFSMLSGHGAALAVVTALMIAALTFWLLRNPGAGRTFRAGLWLIVGGGLGNLYDRLATSGVADFIDLAFVRFAVFNVADVCICVGAALAVLAAFIEEKRGKG